MSEILYVALDASGVEHAGRGGDHVGVPGDDGEPATTEKSHGLVLRTTVALLEVLDEVIYRAEPVSGVSPIVDGAMTVSTARLTTWTPWGTEAATRFALSCAAHVLGDRADLRLPDGTTLGRVVADAQHVLDEITPDLAERLGYAARLADLWRLHRVRGELGDLAFDLTLDDEAKDLDVFDDPAYETVVPVIDAVLAAIAALRHHVLPRPEEARVDWREALREHRAPDGRSDDRPATAIVTPFGNEMVGGGPHVGRLEPAWTGAREAARHARSGRP